jgi:hypothetical protein
MEDGTRYTAADYQARAMDILERIVEDPRPQGPAKAYCIRCLLYAKYDKFWADAEVLSFKTFESISQAKAFLDSVLAFETPEIPAPKLRIIKPTPHFNSESLPLFKRLSPACVGAHLTEEVRQRLHSDARYRSGGWIWDFGSEFFQCELTVHDLDSELGDPAGYFAIRPIEEREPYRIYCVLVDRFDAEAELVNSVIFGSVAEAKGFLDSVLAFPTPEIPAPR